MEHSKSYLLILIISNYIVFINASVSLRKKEQFKSNNAWERYLINTPGCRIPNVYMKFQRILPLKTGSCGPRNVFAQKTKEQKVRFILRKSYKNCFFRFIYRSKTKSREDLELSYSNWVMFTNGTEYQMTSDHMEVLCDFLYKDFYSLVNKIKLKPRSPEANTRANVIILGIDGVSRARVKQDLPSTFSYLQRNKWLDFLGFHKVVSNTELYLWKLLTNASKLSNGCQPDAYICNELFLWTEFKKAGYITAFGEEGLSLSPTSMTFSIPPTDHYMRPIFMAGEKQTGSLFCTRKISSAEQVLNYAVDFMRTYRDQNYFGVFWINSVSRVPKILDSPLAAFLRKLRHSMFDNTFFFILSNHGMVAGPYRKTYAAYYESRLPMLFVRTPTRFREENFEDYFNLYNNQQRLVSPFDVHLTLWHIAKNLDNIARVHDSCPKCVSLFQEIPLARHCVDAGIESVWCTCAEMTPAMDYGAYYSLIQSMLHLHNKTKTIKTEMCFECVELTLKKLIRSHSYEDIKNRYKFYVMVFVTSPGDLTFEVVVRKDFDHKYEILIPFDSLSEENIHSECTQRKIDRPYCYCNKHC